MALSLIRLAMSANTLTTTTAEPTVMRYFYRMETGQTGDTLTISANQFTDDSGAAVVTSGIVPITSSDTGYYFMEVNGALQESGIYTVNSSIVVLTISNISTIPVSAPITLAVSNFVPVSSSTTTVTT